MQVAIALEPEPACWLETTAETVAFFEERIYSAEGRTALARISGEPLSRVEDLLRRHLGVVFDICHQSVGFEDIRGSLESLVAAGVPILKLQAASALRVPDVTPEVVAELEAFTDTIYLSQTTERRDGRDVHHLHLADAIADYRRDPAGSREWRTHFHLPVFLDDLGSFGTTRSGIEDAHAPARGDSPVGAPRDRDLHLGRPPGAPQVRRHRGLRHARARVGAHLLLGE